MKLNRYEKVIVSDNLPKWEDFEKNTIYYSPKYEVVKFECPCGCGYQVILLTAPEVDIPGRRWRVEINGDKITLYNSVWLTGGSWCKSHFFIRNNEVQWV